MTELEKVMSWLEGLAQDDWRQFHSDSEVSNIAKAALVLLKEQEAIEPKLDVDALVCGNCGHGLIHQERLGEAVLFEERHNYCPQCGQAVKWE